MPPDDNRGWFFIPAELFAELANQGAERFTGGFTGNWRPAGWLTTRATFGYDVVNRNDVQFFPTGEVADYLDKPGRAQDRQPVPDLPDLGGPRRATARFQLSPALGSKTSVGGQFFRDLPAATSPPAAAFRRAPAPSPAPAAPRPRDTTVESRSIGAYVEQEIDAQGTAVRHRRPPLRRQQRVRPELRRHGLSQGQRLVADLRRAVLQPRRIPQHAAAPGRPRRQRTAARHHRRAPVLHARSRAGGGAATTGITFGSLGNTNLKPERSREFELGLDAGFFEDRVTSSSPTTTSAPRTPWSTQRGPVARGLGVPVLQPRRGSRTAASSWPSTPGSSTPSSSPGT